MQDILDCVKYEDLDENDKELADCIGFDNFKNLTRVYGGSTINVKVPQRISIASRNRLICSEFDGGNYKQLAKKYNLEPVFTS